jgi:hypothetical protein
VWSEAEGEVTKKKKAPNGRIGVIENIWASCVKHAGNLQKEDYLKSVRY